MSAEEDVASPSTGSSSDAGRVTGAERVYFVAVGLLAGWVGLPAFLAPSRSEKVLPFAIPPLHARVIGAVYIAGLAIMIGSAVARRWAEIRLVPLMTAIWTGGLLIVTLLHNEDFDFDRVQTQVWFAAYVAYPLIGIWIHLRRRSSDGVDEEPGPVAPDWFRRWLVAQGAVLTIVGVALLIAPGTVADAWPWTVQSLLAQIYSAPFLSFGIGSLLLSRLRTAREMRMSVLGMGVFGVGALVASVIHLELFDAADVAAWIWFAVLGSMIGLALSVLVPRTNTS